MSAFPSVGRDDPVSILIVDDNAAKRTALRAVLRPLGHRLVEADSGVAALRCLMVDDFAVILLDVRMPIMDGFQTAKLIRQRERSELTPIIFVTAYRSDELLTTERYAEGAVDFMYAPVDPDELRSKVTVLSKLFSRNDKLEAQIALMGSGGEQVKQVLDVGVVVDTPPPPAGQMQRTALEMVEISDLLLATDLSKGQRQQVAALRSAADALAAGDVSTPSLPEPRANTWLAPVPSLDTTTRGDDGYADTPGGH